MDQSMAMALFMPIIPRHHRLLTRLVEQKKVDRLGCIGWRGLMDEEESFTVDQLFLPLAERGLIENLSQTELGNAGVHFVRITPMGEHCLGLGYMLRDPREMTGYELTQFPAPITFVTDPPTAEQRTRIIEGETT